MMNKKALIAEFVGTFALIFIGVGSVVADQLTGGKVGLTGIALAHGLTIAVMVSATAAISGGHLNPAVTIGLWSVRKIDSVNALGYIGAQLLGGIVAALLLKASIPTPILAAISMGTPALGPEISINMGLLTEIILTFLLVFVVFGTGVDPRGPKCGGLFIGLTVAVDILMGGPITGGAMNPARYLGPALVGGGLQHLAIYIIGPIAGGILAAQVYKTQLE
jgi:aquaporin TIP